MYFRFTRRLPQGSMFYAMVILIFLFLSCSYIVWHHISNWLSEVRSPKFCLSFQSAGDVLLDRDVLWHVRLVCDIYFGDAYSYRCHSTVFYSWKLKIRRLIFLINCRPNLAINMIGRAKKKMRNEWLTMSAIAKESVLFDSKPSPG